MRESAARGVGAIPHFVPRHPYERWCRRSSLPANFRKCRRVRVSLPLIELSHFALLVHRFLRLSSFFYSITLVSLSLSLSLSLSVSLVLSLSLSFSLCSSFAVRYRFESFYRTALNVISSVEVRRARVTTVYRLTLWPSFIDQRFSVATDAARHTRYIFTYTQCAQYPGNDRERNKRIETSLRELKNHHRL